MAVSQKKYLMIHSCALFLGIAIMAFPASLNQQADSYDYTALTASEVIVSEVDKSIENTDDKTPVQDHVEISNKNTQQAIAKPKLDRLIKLESKQVTKSAELRLPKTAHIQSVPKVMKPTVKRPSKRESHTTFKSRSQGLYNTLELEFNDSEKIRSWASVMPTVLQDQRSFKSCISHESNCGFDSLSQWARDLRHMKGQPLDVLVRQVNMRVNSLSYQSDAARYGGVDRWLAPRDFLLMGGDCEDFALLKMASLSALGVSEDNMRIVVGKLDDVRAHAVLNVNIAGEDTILDNRKSGILLAHTRDFHPKYSMNFKKRWTHVERQPTVLYAHNIAR